MTPEELQDYEKNKKINGKRGKFLSIGVWIDGKYFHSKKEGNYYGTVKMKLLAGDINRFRRQVVYKIVINDILVTRYIADFVEYDWHGGFKIIDVKSDFTRTLEPYKIKKKLMKALYNIDIQEV